MGGSNKRYEADKSFEGTKYSADSQSQNAEKERQFKSSQDSLMYNRALQNYNQVLGRGQAAQAGGEQGFLDETGSAPAELQAYQQAYKANALPAQLENQSQQRLNLVKSGVRGPAQARLLNKSTGDFNLGLNKDLTQMMYDEALKRRDSRSAYFGDKAKMGQNATLQRMGQ